MASETTVADSVASSIASASSASSASRASASAAASLSSIMAASLSSLSASLASESATATSFSSTLSGPEGTGSVQNDSSGSSFPRWAIAVIVVLGLLALIVTGVLAFFISRRVRGLRGASLSHRGSMGSSTPMMANATHNTQSPLLGPAALASAGMGTHRPNSPEVHDGASTTSRGSDAAPFSGADAAVMANAFRDMLRKPNFMDRSMEEGDNPEDQTAPDPLINRELAEEGRDIRSVSSSRGVKVETLSGEDEADTVQDHPH